MTASGMIERWPRGICFLNRVALRFRIIQRKRGQLVRPWVCSPMVTSSSPLRATGGYPIVNFRAPWD
ncbi:hypothetical protein CK203_029955 [Vitis vinifera]|uniref:Uncharacterized protein n=1 Tax=Vitis vinifera TaxID=29760 RepID=A0A438IKD4_VITVI|nr:hypothetical protein CK203_029955 [Vitis vinifera]